MLEYLLIFLITMGVMTGSVLLHMRLRVPRYRIERADLRELLEQAIHQRATVDRWELVTGLSIRHDPQLADWQVRCREIGEQMQAPELRLGTAICRFKPGAMQALRAILQEMEAAEGSTIERQF